MSGLRWRQEIVVIMDVHLRCQIDLPQVVRAVRPLGNGFGAPRSSQEKRGQNADDGDNHQQFDQSKTRFSFL